LRNHGVFVFDFHLQVLGRYDGAAQFKNGGELVGPESMLRVVAQPQLEHAARLGMRFSAAVDEDFADLANLGQMIGCGNLAAVGQDEAHTASTMRGQEMFEFAEFHSLIG
jgi:hypothetical protein